MTNVSRTLGRLTVPVWTEMYERIANFMQNDDGKHHVANEVRRILGVRL